MAKKSQFRVGGKLWDSKLGRFITVEQARMGTKKGTQQALFVEGKASMKKRGQAAAAKPKPKALKGSTNLSLGSFLAKVAGQIARRLGKDWTADLDVFAGVPTIVFTGPNVLAKSRFRIGVKGPKKAKSTYLTVSTSIKKGRGKVRAIGTIDSDMMEPIRSGDIAIGVSDLISSKM